MINKKYEKFSSTRCINFAILFCKYRITNLSKHTIIYKIVIVVKLFSNFIVLWIFIRISDQLVSSSEMAESSFNSQWDSWQWESFAIWKVSLLKITLASMILLLLSTMVIIITTILFNFITRIFICFFNALVVCFFWKLVVGGEYWKRKK